jgi:L-aminopeptidase/D-esterase-like protein
MADDKKPSNYDDVMDAKMQVKKDAAYDAADSTPPNPKSTAGAGQGMRGMKKMAKGGSASSRADGIAQRGKTRGMMC